MDKLFMILGTTSGVIVVVAYLTCVSYGFSILIKEYREEKISRERLDKRCKENTKRLLKTKFTRYPK